MPVYVLIADDEAIAREALKLFFDRNFPECRIFLAKDGLEALRMCRTQQFDLLLVDIEMPGLNGLELMNSLKQNGFDGQLLVITAYPRFSYAQKAVEFGASAYILKPIQTDELCCQVSACLEKQRKRRESSSKMQTMQKRLIEAFRPAEKDFWDALHNQRYAALQKMLDDGVLGFSQIAGVFIRLAPGTAVNQTSSIQMLEQTLQLSLANHFTVYLDVSDKENFCVFLNSNDTDEKYLKFAPYLLASVFMKYGYPQVRIWCSKPLKTIRELLFAGHSNARFSQDGSPILFEQSNPLSLKKNIGLQNRLMRAGSGGPGQRTAVIQYLQERYFSDSHDKQDETFDTIIFIILDIVLKRVSPDKADATIEKLLDAAAASGTPLHKVDNMLQLLSWSLEEDDTEYAKTAVERALIFMKENLSSPITLYDTAKYAGLSEYHFSRVFSKLTGRKYIEYLTELRMEQAKKLLSEKNISLNELSLLCGYQSVSYFCTVFKRYTGKTINQYKSHLAMEK